MKKRKKVTSKIMRQIYGKSYADEVATVLENLDPELNQIIQDVSYDILWARPELSMREKSMITVAALVVRAKRHRLEYI